MLGLLKPLTIVQATMAVLGALLAIGGVIVVLTQESRDAVGLFVPAVILFGFAFLFIEPMKRSHRAQVRRLSAARRLTGPWTLMTFEPERRLEPTQASLLTGHLGKILVFHPHEVVAKGAGGSVRRAYEVTEAHGDRLTVVVRDDGGIEYEVVGERKGDDLSFESLTAPWRGRGVLRRPP